MGGKSLQSLFFTNMNSKVCLPLNFVQMFMVPRGWILMDTPIFDALTSAEFHIRGAHNRMRWPRVTPWLCGTPQPAQSSTLHVRYINNFWHFLSAVLHLCGFCLGPPRSALAMPGSPCLYLCHRNNPEECLWQVYRRCCLLLPDWGGLHGCMNRQAITSHASWQQTLAFYWSNNKHAVLMHWGRDLCDMSASSGARGAAFFTVSGQLWMYRHHITHMLCL